MFQEILDGILDQVVPLNWHIEHPRQQQSIFSKVRTNEYVDPELLEGFKHHKMGISFVGNPRYDVIARDHTNELAQLAAYNALYDKHTKGIQTHWTLAKYKWGRITPKKSLSLSVFHRQTRHALALDNYIDLDMVNCQPSILAAHCGQLPVPALRAYVQDPKTLRALVAAHYKVCKDTAKQLMLRLTFGGTYKNWLKDFALPDLPPLREIVEFERNMEAIMELVYANNPQIIKDVMRDNKKEYTLPEKKRTTMALWAQTHERLCQEAAIASLNIPLGDVVPCQDGFMILKKHFFPGIEQFLERAVYTACDLRVNWSVKPFDEAITIPRVPVYKDRMAAERELVVAEKSKRKNSLQERNDALFKEMAAEFEKDHALIQDEGFYILETEAGVKFVSYAILRSGNTFATCGVNERGEPVNFFNKWSKDNDGIRRYKSVGCFPEPNTCPPNVFNLWRPFPVVEWPVAPFCHEPDLFEQHVHVLCETEELTEYTLDWFGHALAFPWQHSTMPVFVSKPGAGKETMLEFFVRMMGRSKICSTTKPMRDVFGEFNSPMASAYLVILSEVSAADMLHSEGQLKALITDNSMVINTKGVKQYEMSCFLKFIAFTNDAKAIKVDVNDRRKCLIKCTKAGDRFNKNGKTPKQIADIDAYFAPLHAALEDKAYLRHLYDRLTTRENLDGFGSRLPPRSEYFIEQTLLTRPLILCWLDSLVQEPGPLESTYSKTELWMTFSDWKTSSKNTYDYPQAIFNYDFKQISKDFKGIRAHRTAHSRGTIINWASLRQSLEENRVSDDN
jgi:hypothetical protein